MSFYQRRSGVWEVMGTETPVSLSAVATAVLRVLKQQAMTSPGGTGGPGTQAGALRPGQQSYPVPAGSLFFDNVNGVDTNAGTIDAPVKTIDRAFALAPVGGWIVGRGATTDAERAAGKGVYAHGFRVNTSTYNGTVASVGKSWSKRVNMQAYPGEEMWLDGSVRHTGWTQSGNVWSKPIVASFDRGHTDSYGKLDNDPRGAGWTWVRPDFPLAACPEQVFVDGEQLTQVATLAEVNGPGKFFVDGTYSGLNNVLFTTSRFYLWAPGSKNPNTAKTDVTELSTAFTVLDRNPSDSGYLTTPGSIFRGFGVRRYATANSQGGTVKTNRAGTRFENIYLEDSATVGFSAFNSDNAKWINCEAQRCGILGFKNHSSYSIDYDFCVAEYCNNQRFYWAPVSGGIKFTAVRDVRVRGGRFRYNWTKGIWYDVSCYNTWVISCDLSHNEQFGIVFEIGAKARIVDCIIVGTGKDGMLLHDTHDVEIWNSVVADSGALRNTGMVDDRNPRTIRIFQDNRRQYDSPSDGGLYPDYGRDPRQPVPDPTVNNWLIQHIGIWNTILADGDVQFSYWPVEDLQKNEGFSRDWRKYGLAANGNLYHRRDFSSSYTLAANGTKSGIGWAFMLPGDGTAQTVLGGSTAFAQWRSTTGLDSQSAELVTATMPVDEKGWISSTALAAWQGAGGVATPLPAEVAQELGRTDAPAGTRQLGPFRTAATTPPAGTTWQAKLLQGTSSDPTEVGILGDSIAFGSGKAQGLPGATGNSAPKYRWSWPGQLREALKGAYGDAGSGWVLMNHALNPIVSDPSAAGYNVGWDDRLSVVGSITEVFRGPFKHACFEIPDGGATNPTSYVQWKGVGREFAALTLAYASGTSRLMMQVDGAAPIAMQNTASLPSGFTPGVARDSGTHPYHLVHRIPVPDDGQAHTVKIWGNGGPVQLAAVRQRTYAGRIEISNVSISGDSLLTFMGSGNNDETTGRYGLPFVDTFRFDFLWIALGSNDYNAGRDLASVTGWLNTLIDRQRAARGSDSVGIVVSPLSSPALYPGSPAPTKEEYARAIQEVGSSKGVPVVNLSYLWGSTFAESNAVVPQKYVDRTAHPTDSGAADIAAAVKSASRL